MGMTPDRKAPERVWVSFHPNARLPLLKQRPDEHSEKYYSYLPYLPESLLLSSQQRVSELEKENERLKKEVVCLEKSMGVVLDVVGGLENNSEREGEIEVTLAGIRHHIYGTQISLSEMRGEDGPWNDWKGAALRVGSEKGKP
jgi:hypothetical protein